MEFLGHKLVPMFTAEEPPCRTQWLHRQAFPPAGAPFPSHSSLTRLSGLRDNRHSNRHEAILAMVLMCTSLVISDVEYLYMFPLAI